MKFTYYGHSCFQLETMGKRILFDPFITGNELAKDVDLASIKADYILISHGHSDHIGDAVALAKQTGAVCVSSWEVVQWLGAQGVTNVHPMNLGGKWQFDFGTVKFVQAVHSSSFPDGSYAGNPGGFIITSEEGCVYFAGDTALFGDMKLLGKQHEFSVVILPIGDNFTMGLDDAIIAAKFLKCNEVIGVHFDTFGYIKVNHAEAKERFAKKDLVLHLPTIGQSIQL